MLIPAAQVCLHVKTMSQSAKCASTCRIHPKEQSSGDMAVLYGAAVASYSACKFVHGMS